MLADEIHMSFNAKKSATFAKPKTVSDNQRNFNFKIFNMTLTISPILDIILLVVTLYYGFLFIRKEHDLLAVGYFMIAITCIVGIFDLSGLARFHWLHTFLDAVSRLAGTPTMGLGIIAMLLGIKNQKYMAYAITIISPTVTYLFFEIYPSTVFLLEIILGSIFLIPLIIIGIKLWNMGNKKVAFYAFIAVALFFFVGLILPTLPPNNYLKEVDILHISIITGYPLVYFSILTYDQTKKLDSR